MRYLLFKLKNKKTPYLLVSPKVLYLLEATAYSLWKETDNQEILKEGKQIEREQILKLIATKKNKEVQLFNLEEKELLRLNFEKASILKAFLKALPELRKIKKKSVSRIKPLNALLVMLCSYSFIWAGTRPSDLDLNPEGIRWKIAYRTVEFLAWLNGIVGQKILLIMGILFLLILLYFIFRPELDDLFGNSIEYSNTGLGG